MQHTVLGAVGDSKMHWRISALKDVLESARKLTVVPVNAELKSRLESSEARKEARGVVGRFRGRGRVCVFC